MAEIFKNKKNEKKKKKKNAKIVIFPKEIP